MTAIYRGQPVTVLRPATPEDQVVNVLIRMSDGTEKIVAKSDISEKPDAVASVGMPPTPPQPTPNSSTVYREASARPRAGMSQGQNTEETTVKYQGKNVTNQREAHQGDAGWVKDTDQIVIKLDDGSEKTIKRSELAA